ncbi:MAG: RNA methyltransferase [Acidimicrobiales bacterium]
MTVYGRMPVLEALLDEALAVDKVVLATGAHGPSVDDIVAAARRRDVPVERADATRVTRLSRNGRHDQGVVADVVAPGLADLDAWLAGGGGASPGEAATDVLVLDGVTNPANVGMVLRVATAAGLAVALPRQGSPDVGPLVVKASAGVAFRAQVLRCPTAAAGCRSLAAAGWSLVALDAAAPATIWEPLAAPVALVLGGETGGIGPEAAALVAERRAIPLGAGVESLNVATAAAVAAFELRRQRLGRHRPGEAGR